MPAIPLCPSGGITEMSTDNTDWTDISAFVGRVDPQARDVPLLTYKTFGGPVICTGIADPTDIELELLATEGATDPYSVLRAAHFANTPVSLRWSANTGTGAQQWSATDALVLSWDDPELSADSDTLLTALATLSVDQVAWGPVVP